MIIENNDWHFSLDTSDYSDSSPNTVSPNTDFAPTRFWFSYKIIHFYTTNSAIPHSSAIFKNFHIV